MKNKHSLKYYYFIFRHSKYYSPSVYAGIILISIILLIFVIYPQIVNLANINAQVNQLKTEIATLQNNVNNINNMSDSDINNYLTLTNKAVPVTKDFSGLVQSVNMAAIEAGVNLEDYSVKVGQLKGNDSTIYDKFILGVTIDGNTSDIVRFLTSIKQKFPLLTVQDITIADNKANVDLQAAYVPFQRQNIDLRNINLTLDPQALAILQQISSWNVPSQNFNDSSTANNSGSLSPF